MGTLLLAHHNFNLVPTQPQSHAPAECSRSKKRIFITILAEKVQSVSRADRGSRDHSSSSCDDAIGEFLSLDINTFRNPILSFTKSIKLGF